MISTVLFDFDGTLVDSNQLITSSHLYVLEKHFPNQYDEKSVLKFNGPPLRDVYEQIDAENAELLIAEYRKYNIQHHDELVSLFPDVKKSLGKLRENGIQVAIVSTKVRKTLDKGIELFNLAPYFDAIFSGDDYANQKPDPEPILKAMHHLNAKPETTVMVGDNWQDIEAAHRAGVKGIFVEWSEKTIDEIAPFKPDKIVESMSDLTEWIINESTGVA